MKILLDGVLIIGLLIAIRFFGKDIRTLLLMLVSTANLSSASRIVFGILCLWAMVDAVLAFEDAPTWWLGITLSFGSVILNILQISAVALIWRWLSSRRKKNREDSSTVQGVYLTKIETPEGDVMVRTKTRYLWLFSVPRTSVMAFRVGQFVRGGSVQFQWKTGKADVLEWLHNSVVQTLREGVLLSEFRGIADLGIQLMALGPDVPFIPPDAPLPGCLKQISSYVKRVI